MKKESIKRNNKLNNEETKTNSKNYLRKIKLFLIIIQILCLGMFLYQILNYYRYNQENKRLNTLMEDYQKIKEEIKIYEELKNSYTIQLEEEKNVNITIQDLQNKIDALNQEIISLQSKIEDINKKIKDIS